MFDTSFRKRLSLLLFLGFFLFSFSTKALAANFLTTNLDSLLDTYINYFTFFNRTIANLDLTFPKNTPKTEIKTEILASVNQADIYNSYKSYLQAPKPEIPISIGIPTTKSVGTIYIQGPPGPQGPVGPQGPQGPAGTNGGFAPLSAPSWAPSNNNNGQIVGTSGGFASLGVQDLNTTTLNVTGRSTLASLTVTGGITSSGALTGTGLILSGPLSFTGTDHAGIKINNLTTAQRDLLTPTTGMTIFNTTVTKMQVYNGSSWKNVGNPEIGAEVTSGTSGSVLFVDASSNLAQDNTNFSFNDTTNVLSAASFSGPLTGNASTATALAANGANCSAGSAPLGVDASGATESCTDYEEDLSNSAGLLAALSDETGTGVAVFSTTPTLVTPVLVVAAATTINKVTITAPATAATLTIAEGKTLTASNTLTFTGTDSSSVAFGGGGTVAYTANNLSVFAATTSLQLLGVISDETGTGALVFANTPTLVTPVLGVATGTSLATS